MARILLLDGDACLWNSVCVTSWQVKAIPSVERTMIMRGSRSPSPGSWP